MGCFFFCFFFHREQGSFKLVLFKLKGPVLSFTMFFFYMLWFHEITSQPTAVNWAEGMKSDILTMEMYQGVLNTEGKFVFERLHSIKHQLLSLLLLFLGLSAFVFLWIGYEV